jgi:hypothetical protein
VFVATGLIGADLGPGADDAARLLVRVTELGDPPDDDDVNTVDGARIAGRALETPEGSALPLVGVSGAEAPLVTADGGAAGEPGPGAR